MLTTRGHAYIEKTFKTVPICPAWGAGAVGYDQQLR